MSEDETTSVSVEGYSLPPWLLVVPDEPDPPGWDRVRESRREQEEAWGPGFYHKKLDEDIKNITQHPTIVMSTGPYLYDEDGVPAWGAKLKCSECGFEESFRGWGHMVEGIPEDCGRKPKHPDCFLMRGKMRAQYDRRK